MVFTRIDHVEIVPENATKTIAFYIVGLGFRMKNRIPTKIAPMKEIVYLALGDTVIEIISVDDPQPQSPALWKGGCRRIALEVNKMAAAVNYLKDKGITMAREPIDLGDWFRGEITDPGGLMIELRQWK